MIGRCVIQQNQNRAWMEELYEQISERFDRLHEVVKGQITGERFRILKEQEKARCEKQNFIISMMRANKTIQIISKNLYYRFSLEIMKKMNPDFKHEMCLQRLEENFLNDFVGLYRHFFFKYEEMFNFKLKIQNLIRPTNHNLIIDLVKYLLDFSRDYYQQTFFWYMKSQNKTERVQEEIVKDLDQSIREEKPELPSSKKIGRPSLNDIILQKLMGKRQEQSESVLKKDPFKVYEILDTVALPSVAYQQKDLNTNLQVLKMRINEVYRDMKSRNITTKANVQSYFTRYFCDKNENKSKEYVELEDQSMNRITHPFKLALVIQKNGFNYINVAISESRYYSKTKDKKLSPLKVSQRIIPIIENKPKPADYMLTSLKIIRISQNFLPPILGSQPNIANTANTTVNLPFLQNNSRMNLLSSNSAANDEQIQRKVKKASLHHGTQANMSVNEQKITKQKSFRKLSEIKRSFKSQQKREGGILPISNHNLGKEDPEKKIYDWLEKLRQIKQIERRKIMGLS